MVHTDIESDTVNDTDTCSDSYNNSDRDSNSDHDSDITDCDNDDIDGGDDTHGCVISQQTDSKAGLRLPSV